MSRQNNGVFIRVDAGYEIGLGHLMRGVSVAQMILDEYPVRLVSRQLPASVEEELIRDGIQLMRIAEEEEFFELLNSNAIVVLDGYAFDTPYQARVKQTGATLICIDDIHEIKFEADAILNHAPDVSPAQYRATPSTQYGFGLDYVMIRSPFLLSAGAANLIREDGSVMICFGGADPRNLTLSVLKFIISGAYFKKIYVITGAAYAYLNELKGYLADHPKVNHLHDLSSVELSGLMQKVKIAIVPASGILFEAISQGCEVVAGHYIENQKNVYRGFVEAGAIYDAEDFSEPGINRALEFVKQGKGLNLPIIDGRSGERIKRLIANARMSNNLKLQPASPSDEATTYRWAADPIVRKFAFNKATISDAGHSAWFGQKIADPFCLYLIARIDDEPCGSVRFDISGQNATLSYLLDPAFHGRRLSTTLLWKGIEYLKNNSTVRNITALVFPDNISSVKAFRKLGFCARTSADHLEFTFNLYD